MKKYILTAFLLCFNLNIFAQNEAERVNGGGVSGGGGFTEKTNKVSDVYLYSVSNSGGPGGGIVGGR